MKLEIPHHVKIMSKQTLSKVDKVSVGTSMLEPSPDMMDLRLPIADFMAKSNQDELFFSVNAVMSSGKAIGVHEIGLWQDDTLLAIVYKKHDKVNHQPLFLMKPNFIYLVGLQIDNNVIELVVDERDDLTYAMAGVLLGVPQNNSNSPPLLPQIIGIDKGGTGATDSQTARYNLGLGSASTKDVGLETGNLVEMTAKGIAGTGFGINRGSWGGMVQDFQEVVPSGLYVGNGTASSNYPSHLTRYGAFLRSWRGNTSITLSFFGADVFSTTHDTVSDVITHARVYTDKSIVNEHIQTASIKSGSASYKKGWRVRTVTLPNQAGEIMIAHGVTNLEMIQGMCVDSQGFQVWQNDPDPTRQFYIRAKSGNVYLGVASDATKVFGKTVELFIGERL